MMNVDISDACFYCYSATSLLAQIDRNMLLFAFSVFFALYSTMCTRIVVRQTVAGINFVCNNKTVDAVVYGNTYNRQGRPVVKEEDL